MSTNHDFPTLTQWLGDNRAELYLGPACTAEDVRARNQEAEAYMSEFGDWVVIDVPDHAALTLGAFSTYGMSDAVFCLYKSNHEAFWAGFPEDTETETVDVRPHGYGGPRTLHLVRADSEGAQYAWDCISALESYPILDDEDFSEREREAANNAWASCYSEQDRIDYIRANRNDFDFRDMADMMSCVRGEYFAGDASELLN